MGKNVLDKKVLRKALDDAVDRAVEERIKPKVKKVLQKHIKEEVVNKDFVDAEKRYRKYYLTADVGPEGHKIKKRLTTLAGHASKYEIENNIPSNELGLVTAKTLHILLLSEEAQNIMLVLSFEYASLTTKEDSLLIRIFLLYGIFSFGFLSVIIVYQSSFP